MYLLRTPHPSQAPRFPETVSVYGYFDYGANTSSPRSEKVFGISHVVWSHSQMKVLGRLRVSCSSRSLEHRPPYPGELNRQVEEAFQAAKKELSDIENRISRLEWETWARPDAVEDLGSAGKAA